MLQLPRLNRGSESEWLDDLEVSKVSEANLSASLREVRTLNRLVGATRTVVGDVTRLLPEGGTVLDVGTGAADTPIALVDAARRRGVPVDVTGVDISREILAEARRFVGDAPINLRIGDARELPFPANSFDVVISLGVIHHFKDVDAVRALREMRRVARVGVLAFDLERTYPTFLIGRAALAILTRNPLTKHDGSISMRRSFTQSEALDLADRAGLQGADVKRRRVILYSLSWRKS